MNLQNDLKNNIKFTDILLKIIEKLNFEICFGVTGGFAMHLNDSFGKSNIKNIYNHHEQASIFSAIGYYKSCKNTNCFNNSWLWCNKYNYWYNGLLAR